MRLNILALIASVALIAACETAPEESAAASGAGASKPVVHDWGTYSSPTTAPTKAGPAPGSQEDLVANVGDRVFFDFDKYNLKADARETLGKQAAWLKKYPSVTVEVEGHCDERGTREYNLALGERRANAAKDYLVALGIDPNRVSTISYGKERPVALGHNEVAWGQNRRGVTNVTGGVPGS